MKYYKLFPICLGRQSSRQSSLVRESDISWEFPSSWKSNILIHLTTGDFYPAMNNKFDYVDPTDLGMNSGQCSLKATL